MVTGEEAIGVRHHEVARRVTEGDLHLGDRRAFGARRVVGVIHEFDLSRFVDVAGQYRRVTGIVMQWSQRDFAYAPAAVTSHRRRRSRRRDESAFR